MSSAQHRLGLPFAEPVAAASAARPDHYKTSLKQLPIAFISSGLNSIQVKATDTTIAGYPSSSGFSGVSSKQYAQATMSSNTWTTLLNVSGAGIVTNIHTACGPSSAGYNVLLEFRCTLDDIVEDFVLTNANGFGTDAFILLGYYQPGAAQLAAASSYASIHTPVLNNHKDPGTVIKDGDNKINGLSITLPQAYQSSLIAPHYFKSRQLPCLRFERNIKIEYKQPHASDTVNYASANKAGVFYHMDIA